MTLPWMSCISAGTAHPWHHTRDVLRTLSRLRHDGAFSRANRRFRHPVHVTFNIHHCSALDLRSAQNTTYERTCICDLFQCELWTEQINCATTEKPFLCARNFQTNPCNRFKTKKGLRYIYGYITAGRRFNIEFSCARNARSVCYWLAQKKIVLQ